MNSVQNSVTEWGPSWTGNGQTSNGSSYSGYVYTNDFGGGTYGSNGQRVWGTY